MKNLILLLTFLVTCTAISQTTLTGNNNPSPGDSRVISSCDTAGITPGNSGANQTWNFTGIVRQDSTLFTWVTAGSTPYAAQFPGSNIAMTSDNSFYNYETTTSTNFIGNGTAGPSFLETYSDPQTLMQYPFTFGSNFSDNFAGTFNISGITGDRSGSTTMTGDAWGTINLPSGSFTNATRVKTVTTSRDSTILFVINSVSTSYSWFVPGKKFPVLEISLISVTQGGTTTNIKSVNYSPNSPSVGIISFNSAVPDGFNLKQNYPNPFNPVTNLEFGIPNTGFVSLKIYDMLGKEVKTLINEILNPGTYKYNFDASGLTSGIYYYKLESKGFSQTKKMILTK